MEIFGAFPDQEWESLSNMFSFEDPDHFLLAPPEINESNYDANPNNSNANLFFLEETNKAFEPMDFFVPSVFSEAMWFGNSESPENPLKRKLESPENLLESPEKVTRVSSEGAKSKRTPRSKKSKKSEVGAVNEETSNNGNGSACSSGKSPATDPQSVYARKRRERINERLKTLQTLVPNGTKVDISTMLEEAVDYVKFLQLQIKLLSSDDTWMFAPIAYNGMDMGLYQKIVPNL